jgi:NAD(P) transhydrogenase
VDQYDLVVLGSGPAGQKAAIQAAKLRKRVAIVERGHLGGVCMHTGTIPSKTLREAVLYLWGYRQRSYYGSSYRVKDDLTIQDLLSRAHMVTERENSVVKDQLARNRVRIVPGEASFKSPNVIRVQTERGSEELETQKVIIATGTRPSRPASIAFDDDKIIDSDGLLELGRLPRSMIVAGAGVIGWEYATIFAAAGVELTLIDKRANPLEFLDSEIIEALKYHSRSLGVTLRFGEEVTRVDKPNADGTVHAELHSSKRIAGDTLLFSAGRHGSTHHLDLPNAGLATDERGRLVVNDEFQTEVPHIYAAGDVIGFPSLASTSMEQGRLAACHAFGVAARSTPQHMPFGIYAIPEIAMVGQTEDQLTAASVPYEVGRAHYREIARGAIVGDDLGMMKLLFHADTRKLLGVHVIGEGATELVHIGQAVMSFGGGLDYFVEAVFNYPTLAECYKVAALDAFNRLGPA